mmetsp:Transcript_9674/g.20407  ORF Transcript_9674/g.20407 Transcript_9674/m.20407 type:complete len:450 (+) Transcript_9674:146-1495(+)
MVEPVVRSVLSRVRRAIESRVLFPLGEQHRILVAASGGRDSLCIGSILCELQREFKWDYLAVAHCDHAWPMDAGVSEHVRAFADSKHLPFHLEIADQNSLSQTETAARAWRYKCLVRLANTHQCDSIVTGHTMSDAVETLILNAVRGSGAAGLGAMAWQRELAPAVRVVRPMLEVKRSETAAFCDAVGVAFLNDYYNTVLDMPRNRVRLEVLPYLRKHFNESIEDTLARTAAILKADSEYIEAKGRELAQRARDFGSQKNPNNPNAGLADSWKDTEPSRPWVSLEGLRLDVLTNAPVALQRAAVRFVLQQMQHRAPSFDQVEDVLRVANACKDPHAHRNRRASLNFPVGCFARRERDVLRFVFITPSSCATRTTTPQHQTNVSIPTRPPPISPQQSHSVTHKTQIPGARHDPNPSTESRRPFSPSSSSTKVPNITEISSSSTLSPSTDQ